MSELLVSTAVQKVIDRILIAKRLGGLYSAEAQGMTAALLDPLPPETIYSSPAWQARFLLGFHEASEILRVESPVAAPELVEHPAAHGY